MKSFEKKELLIISLLFIFVIFSLSSVSADSNSSETKKNLEDAKKCLDEMISLEIPIRRVNESLQETTQLYDAQLNLENQNKKPNYDLVNKNSIEICTIKESAIKAQDELKIFKEKYELSSKDLNLSVIDSEYKEILKSFEEERFEDTVDLIQKGYESLSEVESSQTTVKLFYKSTTATIKNFFINNWGKISIILIILIIVLFVFWRTIRRFNLKMKLYNLAMKEKSVNHLIKKMQYEYFEKKTLSETEFQSKMEKFKNILRDIKRQVPAIKEQLIKVEKSSKFKKAKVYKNK